MAKSASTPAPGNPGGPGGSLPIPKSRRGLRGFFNEVMREMKKVTWPTKAETNRLTGVVIVICVGVVVILSSMGYVCETLIQLLTKGTT